MVSLPKNCPKLAEAALRAGARCLKVHINCHHYASDTLFQSWTKEKSVISEILALCGDVPLGLVTGEDVQPDKEELEEISRFGFDFWDLFCRYTPPHYLSLPGLGRMVAIDSSWEPWLVTALAQLGVDVIESSIIPRDRYRSGLNLEDLARYKRLAEASPLPILIPTQKAILPEEISYLAQIGAAGITIGAVVTGLDAGSLGKATKDFSRAIEQLPPSAF